MVMIDGVVQLLGRTVPDGGDGVQTHPNAVGTGPDICVVSYSLWSALVPNGGRLLSTHSQSEDMLMNMRTCCFVLPTVLFALLAGCRAQKMADVKLQTPGLVPVVVA